MPATAKYGSATGKYEHDLFISYAWGHGPRQDMTLRNWTRRVTDNIHTMLNLRFDNKLEVFLDRDVNEDDSGAEVDLRFKTAVENSAVFVAFVSCYYQCSYAAKELDWFLDAVKADGSTLADRLCIILVQTVPDDKWPSRLRGPSGNRLLYQPFHCKAGDPLDFAAFLYEAPTPALAKPTYGAALDIGRKLAAIRDKAATREAYRSAQRPAVDPIMYLEAEPVDAEIWARRRAELLNSAVILLPTAPVPATEVEDPDDAYSGCDGLVLLRSRSNDNIGRRIKRAYLDRRRVGGKKDIPWALLDEQDVPPPEGEAFHIPRVVPQGDWVDELRRKLHEA